MCFYLIITFILFTHEKTFSVQNCWEAYACVIQIKNINIEILVNGNSWFSLDFCYFI